MSQKHPIGTLASDVLRKLETEARNRGSDMRAPARPAVGVEGSGQPMGREGLDEPTAFTGRNAPRETGMKKSEAVAPAVAVVGHRFPPTIGRSIVTASRTRRPTSAVIIDMAMYRAQRHSAGSKRSAVL